MSGRPNRKHPGELERAVPVGHGVPGSHEFDALWEPSVDPVVLNERIRRYKAHSDKKRRDCADLRAAMRLKTEEAYNEGLLSVAPKLLEIDKAVADLTAALLAAGIDDDNLKVLKALLPELSKQRDRLYGKTRQRVESSSVSASVDINELLRQGRERELLGAGGEPIDVEVLGGDASDE